MNEETPSEWKRAALENFKQWLAEMPDDEPPPAAENTPDLYTLAEELTALRQEMRTLGRGTARLAESSEAVAETVKQELPALLKAQAAPSAAAPDREALARARRAAERDFLIELGDLSVALNELKARPVAMDWPFYVPAAARARLLAARDKPLQALAARVDALLSRHALEPIAQTGEPFDAARMNAAGICADGAVAPGCVSAIARQGFALEGEVLRVAEVIVEEEGK